ncbi:hypothetical protein FHS07_000926 [Microbacterium proteolyticum]|uniref:DUF4333 domain-containing protein n=1 Tax=Microbacterium proteolyticum TaxID=1572644 RepID=A0A7W5GFH8_9MICO|nr:hypothetical protein [Microbacterium proteolyticum]MBB3157242.1 hypothetical protein [Microbacterium proteolyticum]
MRRPLAVLPLVAVLAAAGCSQVAAIAPVGGNHLAEVRFATIDVLHQKGVDLEQAPTCTRAPDGAISCAGTTTAGDAIAATSPSSDPDSFTITVGSDTAFTGSVSAVIDQAAGVTP